MTWRQCIDFPNYEVSRHGEVRRTVHVAHARQPPGLLKPHLDRGYPYVKIRHRSGVLRKAYVHRLVGKAFLGLTDNTQIDHPRHCLDDVTDLRVDTQKQNVHNTRGRWKNRTSRFKGVSWSAKRQLWFACIKLDGRTRSLGHFASEEQAARAYDRATLAAWGEYAFLNFPEGNEVGKFDRHEKTLT